MNWQPLPHTNDTQRLFYRRNERGEIETLSLTAEEAARRFREQGHRRETDGKPQVTNGNGNGDARSGTR